MASPHLLVVDDEDNLRTMLVAALKHHGFAVSTASGGREALELVAGIRPDVILLDVMMPDLDGFEVCRRLRTDGDMTPVIFLTARDGAESRVEGLKLGADDYLEKPFSLDELVARTEAVLRRTRQGNDRNVLVCDDLELDDDAHLVRRAGATIDLSPTEYKLLRHLLANQGRVMSKQQLLAQVWDYDFEGNPAVVETYIGYLRRKLDPNQTKLIHTVRGVGYVLRVEH